MKESVAQETTRKLDPCLIYFRVLLSYFSLKRNVGSHLKELISFALFMAHLLVITRFVIVNVSYRHY